MKESKNFGAKKCPNIRFLTLAKTTEKLKIDILGKMHEVSIIEDSPYDSENKLLRA